MGRLLQSWGQFSQTSQRRGVWCLMPQTQGLTGVRRPLWEVVHVALEATHEWAGRAWKVSGHGWPQTHFHSVVCLLLQTPIGWSSWQPSKLNQGFSGASAVKNPPAMQELQETRVQSLGQEDSLEEGMAPHSSILAWRILWTGAWWTLLKQLSMHTWKSNHHPLNLCCQTGWCVEDLGSEPRTASWGFLQDRDSWGIVKQRWWSERAGAGTGDISADIGSPPPSWDYVSPQPLKTHLWRKGDPRSDWDQIAWGW